MRVMAVLVFVAASALAGCHEPVQEQPVFVSTAHALRKELDNHYWIIQGYLVDNIKHCDAEMEKYMKDTNYVVFHWKQMMKYLPAASVQMLKEDPKVNGRLALQKAMGSTLAVLKELEKDQSLETYGKQEDFEWRKMLLSKGICQNLDEPFCSRLMAVNKEYEDDLAKNKKTVAALKEKMKKQFYDMDI